MKKFTRQKFQEYSQHMASMNGVESVSHQFTVAPSVEQALSEKIGEQSDFLKTINIQGVEELIGEPLKLGIGSTIAGRTDTSGEKSRQTSDPSGMTSRPYELKKTDFDTHILYSKLDAWAKFDNFSQMIASQRVQQIARDRIMIGFNGTSAAPTTDRANNPLLQDVNIGWIEKLRLENPAHILKDLKVGDASGADYKNLDELVYDAVASTLPSRFQNDTSLKAFCGRKLFKDKMLQLLSSSANAATENQAMKTLYSDQTAGGYSAMIPPFINDRTVMVTAPSNLSIYYQTGKIRMHVKDNPERDRIEYFESFNEGYVLEDEEKILVIEGILLPDGNGGWA